jgi:preprotein translocase subunit YajC
VGKKEMINEIKPGDSVRMGEIWMRVTELKGNTATCNYSDGHGIHTITVDISKLRKDTNET